MDKQLLNYFKGDELAANVFQSKYAKNKDETPDDMHKRMAKEFARKESEYPNAFQSFDHSIRLLDSRLSVLRDL